MEPDARLEWIVDEALKRKSCAEREAFLSEACGPDASLRQRVAERLANRAGLAGDERATLADSVPGPGIGIPHHEQPLSEGTGTVIGRYRLLEKLGEGGFGVVYVAEQTEPVKRRVALKLVKLGMDTQQVIARFEAERQALAMMDHPNIAKVFDAGAIGAECDKSQIANRKSEIVAGRPFFVMELVRGIPITAYCDQNGLSTDERLALFIPVCHAVQHAHQKGIIHRDLKPSNILVTLRDGAPAPVVIDFGIAKAMHGGLTDQTVYTQFQQFIGTPAYMSPEQAEMSALDIDTRADIYSLGVLLYELLTGRVPFEPQELLEAGLDEMRRILREREPLRPSTRLSKMTAEELTTTAKRRAAESPKLISVLRGDLDWIVMKCLEKDRTRRFDTASGLAADLERHLNSEPVSARPPSAVYRFGKAVRRNRLAFGAAGAVLIALAAGIALSSWQAVRASREARRAQAAETLARQRLTESEAISKFMTEVFQSPDPARDGRTITVAETLAAAANKLETDLASQPATRARLEATLGWTYYKLGLTREAIPLLEKVHTFYRTNSGAEHPDTLSATHNLATTYAAAGRRDEALRLREEVLAHRRKVLGPEHPDTLAAMNNLAISYAADNRRDQMLKMQEQVLTLSRKVNGSEHLDTIKAMANLASSYADAARGAEALKLREEVLALRRKVLGPEHPDTLKATAALASSYVEAGRGDEALKLREAVLTASRKVYGPEHPETFKAMHNLASSYGDTGRGEEALKLREEVLALRRKLLGPEHVDTLWALDNLASSYAATGRRGEALKLREEGLALRRKVNGPEHPETIWAMENLSFSYADAGRRAEALELREKVLALRRKVLGPEHPETLVALHNLAFSYTEAGRRDEALALREEALTLRRKVNGPEHPETLKAMSNLAMSYQAANRPSEAIALEEQALRLKRQHLPAGHALTLESIENLAALYENAGRSAEAAVLRKELDELRAARPRLP